MTHLKRRSFVVLNTKKTDLRRPIENSGDPKFFYLELRTPFNPIPKPLPFIPPTLLNPFWSKDSSISRSFFSDFFFDYSRISWSSRIFLKGFGKILGSISMIVLALFRKILNLQNLLKIPSKILLLDLTIFCLRLESLNLFLGVIIYDFVLVFNSHPWKNFWYRP